MAFTIYRSTDAGAPVLTGETGKLVALLKACLVDGYGAKAAAGWTEPYTGVSKGAFKQGAGSCGFYLRVKDDGCDEAATPTLATFKEAWITGYETMTDVDTGTGPFPTAAQGVGGVAMQVVRKSLAASAVARVWRIFADSRTIYMLIFTADNPPNCYAWNFGDFCSYTPGDIYCCALTARDTLNSGASSPEWFNTIAAAFLFASYDHTYVARSYTGIGGSTLHAWVGDTTAANSRVPGFQGYQFPNPADGGLILCRIRLGDGITGGLNAIRGHLRGLWQLCHNYAGITDMDTVTGTGDLVGRTFEFALPHNSNIAVGAMTFETSDTLDS
jgi:hypothetical protein